ncbi:hypothetical protein HOC35_01750 [Candidatus Woesearchaeota archaeon]|jgi:hypothetical protein|nr:hypothetical protein [Candidatus Woesearchaeota archaeon]
MADEARIIEPKSEVLYASELTKQFCVGFREKHDDSLDDAVEKALELVADGFNVGFEILVPGSEIRSGINFFALYDQLIKKIAEKSLPEAIKRKFKNYDFKVMGLMPNIVLSRKALGDDHQGVLSVGILNITALENQSMVTVPMELGYEHTLPGSMQQVMNEAYITAGIMESSTHAHTIYNQLRKEKEWLAVRLTEGTYQFGFCQRRKGYSSLKKARGKLITHAEEIFGMKSGSVGYVRLLTHDADTLRKLTFAAESSVFTDNKYEFQAQHGPASQEYKDALNSARDAGHMVRINIPIALRSENAERYVQKMVALNR